LNETEPSPMPLTTKIKSSAQVFFCVGCCCGRTDRGLPEVPVDRIKAAWKSEKLNRSVQLTISGCLGPCDVPNVAAILTPEGMRWYGLLNGDADYDAIIEWARASLAAGEIMPLPEAIESRCLQRFGAKEAAMMPGGSSS
jgi:hypothetical protein